MTDKPLLTGQALAKQSDERAKAHAASLPDPMLPYAKGTSIIKLRDGDELRYAIPLSIKEARWLRGLLVRKNEGLDSKNWNEIIKKLEWVIETATRDGQ